MSDAGTDSNGPYIDAGRQLVMEIYVRDLQKSVSFYEELGFKAGRKDVGFVEVAWERVSLFLEEHKGLTVPSEVVGNLRIMVPDVDTYWTLAGRMGAKVVNEIGDRPHGLRDFIIADPDGFGIRFATPI